VKRFPVLVLAAAATLNLAVAPAEAACGNPLILNQIPDLLAVPGQSTEKYVGYSTKNIPGSVSSDCSLHAVSRQPEHVTLANGQARERLTGSSQPDGVVYNSLLFIYVSPNAPAGRYQVDIVTPTDAGPERTVTNIRVHVTSVALSDSFAFTVPTSHSGHSAALDHPLTNGRPNARLLVTPAATWPGPVQNPHPIGVWYDGDRWQIFNQNFAALPAGAKFNVKVEGDEYDPSTHLLVATGDRKIGHMVAIDHPLANDNPEAVIFITQNWSPHAIYNPSHTGVWFDGSRWLVYNEDLAEMPLNAAFNLKVLGGTGFQVERKRVNLPEGLIWLVWLYHPQDLVQVTHNWNPPGALATYNVHTAGIYYFRDGHAFIKNFDGTPMDTNTVYNYLLPRSPQ
jgi:hypothetical protein